MTKATDNSAGNEGAFSLGEFRLVCDDPASGQSLTFMEQGGVQVVVYRESDDSIRIPLTDVEAAEIAAWRNSGRRNSYWNWPGLEAVKKRAGPS